MTDTEVLDDPLADDVVDEVDIAHTAEDDDPENLAGTEVGFDLGHDAGGDA